MNVHDALGEWSIRPGPIYARLAAALRDAIENGDIAPGTVLPPERSLAARLAIGRSTVVQAYGRLREEQLVVSRQGSGTWVAGARRTAATKRPAASLRLAALRDPEVPVDLATAALPAHARVRQLIADLGRSDDDCTALLDGPGYLPAGLPALRSSLAERLTADGLATIPEQILVTTGDQQALSLLATHALQAGDTVVVESPTSPGMLDVLHGLPVTVRSSRPVTDEGSDLLDVLDRCRPRLAYLMPTLGPHGRMLDHASRGVLARKLAERDVLVIDDASQAGLAFEPAPPLAAFVSADNLITVGSMTKLHWGGLRIGWIRGPAPLIAALARAKARVDLGTPVLDQLIAVRLLCVEDNVRAVRVAWLRDRLDHASTVVRAALPEFSFAPPDGGMNLWLRLPAGTATAFSEVATRFGVAVVPGSALSAQGIADDHVRVVYARPREVFEEGVRRLAAAWQRYRTMPPDTAPVLL
ncbi:aminotransferase-like domain-containing protein [Allokutzneria albata]|uniref:DNA-binding transcriptional regulator, MocR family, contains an aminotransferase domain n=1 Tax=Allokutzneria albata TaxID=211114 RepID=A0A1G9SWP7_ALLAB|nr:PLP-dependent aminotransferase family protein [Allokutzneria albata]SDM39878.1 DNA-binding transcriptional regulator, MocR family, contains an aminotransferase domain [Allokutzneria albata]